MADIGNPIPPSLFAGLTTGATIVSGDLPSGWGVTGTGGALTVVAKTWTHGTKGAQFNNATTSRAFIESGSYGTGVACQWIYFILDSISATAIILSGGTGSANWRLNANRTVQARNNTTAVGSASGVIITADGTTVYRAEHSTNPGAGTQQLKIFAADDNTTPLYDSGSQTLVGTTRTNYQFGATAAAAGVVVTLLAAGVVDTAWSGPVLAGSPDATVIAASVPSVTVTALPGKVLTPKWTYSLTYPVYASHRGGTLALPHGGPEETLGTYTRSLALSPGSGLECDVTPSSDGFVLSHDDTVDRTADASSPITTGAISGLTTAQYKTVKTTDLSGNGNAAENAISLDDYATAFGPSSGVDCWLIPEFKGGGDTTAFVAKLNALGIGSRAIIQAFSRTSAESIAAAGFETLHLIASGGDITWSAIKAAGINHVARNSTLWTTGDITAAKAAGLKTWVFTINTTVDRATWLGNGIDGGFFTDRPDLLNPNPNATVVAASRPAVSVTALAGSVTATRNVTISGPLTSVTATGLAGTVAAVRSPTVVGPTPSVTTTALAGSVATTRNPTVAGPVTSVTTTALAGTVAAVRNATLTAPAPTVTVTALAGTISTTANPTVIGPTTTVTASAPAGTVVTGGSVAVSGSVVTVTSNALAGAVAATRQVTVTGPTTTITAAALAGNISTTSSATTAGVLCSVVVTALPGGVMTSSTASVTVAGAVAGVAVKAWAGSVSALAGGVVTPPSRIYPIPPEVRVMAIGRETRVYPVPAATRVLAVPS